MSFRLQTERLLLRDWRDEDLPAFAALNADPAVMEHFPKVLERAESDELARKIRASLATSRFGWWALEVPGVTPFAGFVGLFSPTFEAHFTPAVEIGWRLARTAWGHGFATEAARAALAYGFDVLGLAEIVSMTVPANTRSRHVMEKLGMTRALEDDFDHPRVPEGHPLRRHVLYRLRRPKDGTLPAIKAAMGSKG